jgi:hypothetical protein
MRRVGAWMLLAKSLENNESRPESIEPAQPAAGLAIMQQAQPQPLAAVLPRYMYVLYVLLYVPAGLCVSEGAWVCRDQLAQRPTYGTPGYQRLCDSLDTPATCARRGW